MCKLAGLYEKAVVIFRYFRKCFDTSFTSSSSTESDCILHGYIKKLGGPFASAWQTRYAKLYPNRLELHFENSTKPEMILLDSVEDVSSDLVSVKGEQCIVLRTRNDTKIVLTNTVRLCFIKKLAVGQMSYCQKFFFIRFTLSRGSSKIISRKLYRVLQYLFLGDRRYICVHMKQDDVCRVN